MHRVPGMRSRSLCQLLCARSRAFRRCACHANPYSHVSLSAPIGAFYSGSVTKDRALRRRFPEAATHSKGGRVCVSCVFLSRCSFMIASSRCCPYGIAGPSPQIRVPSVAVRMRLLWTSLPQPIHSVVLCVANATPPSRAGLGRDQHATRLPRDPACRLMTMPRSD